MSPDNLERELKLQPHDPALLERLGSLAQLGAFAVTGRRHELQHNSFFDSASHGLSQARLSFRRRIVEGETLATWTVKGEAKQALGVATRTEIELRLAAELAPALALDALRQAARGRGAVALAEALADGIATGGLPLARPFLESRTRRTILDLESGDTRVELALDRVRLIGHAYAELEIEAELKQGDEAALEAARSAIAAVGDVYESRGSKLSRAMEHVAACDGCGRQSGEGSAS